MTANRSKARYTRGTAITDPIAAATLILRGETLFHNHKVQSAGWLQNWSLAQIRRACSLRQLYFARKPLKKEQNNG